MRHVPPTLHHLPPTPATTARTTTPAAMAPAAVAPAAVAPAAGRSPTVRWRPHTVARWMVTFAGFPLGGLTAKLVAGPVNSLTAALLGGLVTGAILGAVQAWGLGRSGPPARQWVAATALGLSVGLGLGATLVDFETSLTALVVQGAACGLAVGGAQAVVLRRRLGRLTLAWPPVLAALWAIGWSITTSAGVQVDEQFTVFGSTGAVTVTALTAVLPLVLNRRQVSAS